MGKEMEMEMEMESGNGVRSHTHLGLTAESWGDDAKGSDGRTRR